MALKRKIDKTAFDKLTPELQKEYKKNGSSDDYILDTDGDDDASAALKTALENERKESARLKAEAETRRIEAETKAAQEEQERQRKAGDFKSIEDGYKSQIEKLKGENATMKTEHTKKMSDVLAGGAANTLAAKISTSPSLIEPVIRNRLTVDDNGVVRVLGLDGKASALSVEDLGKELATNKEYSAIMIANRGSGGGGAPPGQGGKGGALGPRLPNTNDGKPQILAGMNPKDLARAMADRKAQAAEENANAT